MTLVISRFDTSFFDRTHEAAASVLRGFGTLNWTQTFNPFRDILAPLLALAACLSATICIR